MRTFVKISLSVAVAALSMTACAVPSGTATTTATVTAPAAPESPSTAPAAVQRTTTAPAEIEVPDVSGMNHQDAQDTMQAAGLYNLREVDSSGKNRVMVLDRNWCQTGQDPKPGAKVLANAVITLYADKC